MVDQDLLGLILLRLATLDVLIIVQKRVVVDLDTQCAEKPYSRSRCVSVRFRLSM